MLSRPASIALATVDRNNATCVVIGSTGTGRCCVMRRRGHAG